VTVAYNALSHPKIIGWGRMYLSTVLDDFSRYVIAWKLCTTMRAEDATDTWTWPEGVRLRSGHCAAQTKAAQ
jgi:hypothetical protein